MGSSPSEAAKSARSRAESEKATQGQGWEVVRAVARSCGPLLLQGERRLREGWSRPGQQRPAFPQSHGDPLQGRGHPRRCLGSQGPHPARRDRQDRRPAGCWFGVRCLPCAPGNDRLPPTAGSWTTPQVAWWTEHEASEGQSHFLP
ncbi:hypothetical protein H1C71_026967 [Ictidomys tridecemlineatus]|nr:hypothetical protein H1C71_026967 [Ictidomys tridecemlineatus]